jgi:hypothetical protein
MVISECTAPEALVSLPVGATESVRPVVLLYFCPALVLDQKNVVLHITPLLSSIIANAI